VRWYVIAVVVLPTAVTLVAIAVYGGDALHPPNGWPRAIGGVLALFVIQVFLFQLAEEAGWTGFFQERLHSRYSPLKLCAVVAFFWAIWHMPEFFADEGWTLGTAAVAPVFFVIELIGLFFARVLIVWIYSNTGRSVLLVILFHACFDATISRLSHVIIPSSDGVRFVIVTGVIVVAAAAVIVATHGRLDRGDELGYVRA
jgi:membrane protease YdiL (CAAX protease family)